MASGLLTLAPMRTPWIIVVLVALPVAGIPAGAADFRYRLADFGGPVAVSRPHLSVDDHHGEVYTVFANDVRVFNGTGMEVFRFHSAAELGLVVDLAVVEEGDLLVLSHEAPGSREWFVTRCDYRGRPLERVEFRDWPRTQASAVPDLLFVRGERLVLASLRDLALIETTLSGRVVRTLDLGDLVGIAEEDRATVQVGDLDVDEAGNVAMTLPVLFRVAVVSRDGKVRQFGRAGSGAGNFGNVSGIAARGGRLYVADRLRHVVMVFDAGTLEFVEEFGNRGDRSGRLVGPSDVAVSAEGEVFVGQAAGRGVSVFQVSSE